MKKIIYILMLSVAFVSCKSKSNIVTSKEIALEKGIYEYNKDKSIAIAKKHLKRRLKKHKKRKKNKMQLLLKPKKRRKKL